VATFSGDTDGCATVGNTICEGINVASLVFASKTQGVVLSVHRNVLLVAALKLLDGSFNVLHAALNTHLLAGEVAMETSTIPVTWNWLGVERDLGTEFFGDTVEQETSRPEVITQLNTFTRANLKLPLSWHDLGVCSGKF